MSKQYKCPSIGILVVMLMSGQAFGYGQVATSEVGAIRPDDWPAETFGGSLTEDGVAGEPNVHQAGQGVPFAIEFQPVQWAPPHGSPNVLPKLQSFAVGVTSNGLWVLMCGRTAGLHGFAEGASSDDPPSSNFPLRELNDRVYVVDLKSQNVWSADLQRLFGDLANSLRVTNPQSCQVGSHLIVVGGYGYTTSGRAMSTKDTLTRIDLDQLAKAVINPSEPVGRLAQQAAHQRLQVAGGVLLHDSGVFYLAYGQNFAGFYTPTTNGVYTHEVRTFQLKETGGQLELADVRAYPPPSDELKDEFRRRDLNVAPVLRGQGLTWGMSVLGGVFTRDTNSVFTHPIQVQPTAQGVSLTVSTQDEQLMSQYETASVSLWSEGTNYTVLMGGISLVYYDARRNVFARDDHIPFIDQVSCVAQNDDTFLEYLMIKPETQDTPVTLPARMGAEAHYVSALSGDLIDRGVIRLDLLSGRTLVGRIFGGIVAEEANGGPTDATDAIIEVWITPVDEHVVTSIPVRVN